MKIKKYTNGAWTDLDKPVKKFGAYTDTATTLPLTIEASATDAIENYQVYGTSEGVGVETKNIFNKDDFEGYRPSSLSRENEWYKSQSGAVIRQRCKPNTVYTVCSLNYSQAALWRISITNSDNIPGSSAVACTDIVKQLSGGGKTKFTTLSDTKYILVQMPDYETYPFLLENLMILEDVFTAPASYIPPGYKLPLTVESGAQSQDIPIYIGSTKLGAEEYADFGEQKVYKRTENLFDKDATFDVGYLNAGAGTVNPSNTNYRTTDYIKVTGQNVISLVNPYYSTSTGSLTRIALYDNAKTYISDVVSSGTRPEQYSATFDTGTGEKYIRISIRITDYDIMLVSGSTAPESYIPYFQPTDPPVPLPPIPTYIGENSIDVDTQVQPEKVVLEYAGWREIDAKKYVNGEWVTITPKQYTGGSWS